MLNKITIAISVFAIFAVLFGGSFVTADEISDHHAVQPGDTLGTIAAREYGDSDLWNVIYEANLEIIGDNPDILEPGIVLAIPPESEVGGFVFNDGVAPAALPDVPVESADTAAPADEMPAEMATEMGQLENEIDSFMVKPPHNVLYKSVYADPALAARQIALRNEMENLGTDLMIDGMTAENYDKFQTRYEDLHQRYMNLSRDIFLNHFKYLPLPPHTNIDVHTTLGDYATDLKSVSAEELPEMLDHCWDYAYSSL